MSQVFGNGDWQPASLYKLYSKYTTIDLPSTFYVFADEHPQMINDAAFGWSDTPQAIVDYPAGYHSRGAGFGFCDGHAEIHKWQSTEISPPVVDRGPLTTTLGAGRKVPTTAEGIRDVAWVCAHDTILK